MGKSKQPKVAGLGTLGGSGVSGDEEAGGKMVKSEVELVEEASRGTIAPTNEGGCKTGSTRRGLGLSPSRLVTPAAQVKAILRRPGPSQGAG